MILPPGVTTPPVPTRSQIARNIFIALGIILLVGSLMAATLEYTSLTFTAACVGVSILSFLLSYYLDSQSQASEIPSRVVTVSYKSRVTKTANSYAYRAAIFKETLEACKRGYGNVVINNEPMLLGTKSFGELPPLGELRAPYRTEFSVVEDDTLNVLINLRKSGLNPVGINMANRHEAGGGVVEGCPAQEEALCRRSNHILGLKTQRYPLSEVGGIYCPHVQVFREDEGHEFAFMEKPEEVALVATAAYDLREVSGDRTELGIPLRGPISESILEGNAKYRDMTKRKIKNMLRIMSQNDHTHIVLGAFGCGAFINPPKLMATLFHEVFSDPEFKGRFQTVRFAILNIFPKDKDNITAFTTMCSSL